MAKAVMVVWGLCAASLVVAFGSLGFFKLFTAPGDCIAGSGCFGNAFVPDFWATFATAFFLALVAGILSLAWVMWRRRTHEG